MPSEKMTDWRQDSKVGRHWATEWSELHSEPVGTRCPGLLTPLVQTHRLGEVRHQQAVDNESRRVLRMKRRLASPGGRHAASMLTDPSEAQSSPCRTPGFFPALCWSSARSRKSLGSWTTLRWPERDEGKVKRDAAVETHRQWTSSCSCSCLVVKPVTWSQVDSLDSTSAKPWPNTWWLMSSHFLLYEWENSIPQW